jgi:hypothetical protein
MFGFGNFESKTNFSSHFPGIVGINLSILRINDPTKCFMHCNLISRIRLRQTINGRLMPSGTMVNSGVYSLSRTMDRWHLAAYWVKLSTNVPGALAAVVDQ